MQDDSNEVPSTNVTIDVPDYSRERGMRMEWETDTEIKTRLEDGGMVLVANESGLVSLARLFLTLANAEVSSGSHWHLDDLNCFEDGSVELIVEKM